jgi:hypothetical protein
MAGRSLSMAGTDGWILPDPWVRGTVPRSSGCPARINPPYRRLARRNAERTDGLEVGMTIRVMSDAGVAAPLALLLLLLGDAGPASAQGRGEERSRTAVEMCLDRAEDVLRNREGGVDIEVDEITGVDERGDDRMRVQGRLRVGDEGRRGTAQLDCEVDLSGVDRVTHLDEDGLLRGLDRRRKHDRDRDLSRNGDAIGGDGGDAIAKGGVAIGGRGGDAKGGNAVAIGGRGGDAKGGSAAAGRDGSCRVERGRDGGAGGQGARGGDAIGGRGGKGGDGGDAVGGRGGDASCF